VVVPWLWQPSHLGRTEKAAPNGPRNAGRSLQATADRRRRGLADAGTANRRHRKVAGALVGYATVRRQKQWSAAIATAGCCCPEAVTRTASAGLAMVAASPSEQPRRVRRICGSFWARARLNPRKQKIDVLEEPDGSHGVPVRVQALGSLQRLVDTAQSGSQGRCHARHARLVSSVGMRVVSVDRVSGTLAPHLPKRFVRIEEHHAFGNEQLATVVALLHRWLALFEPPAQQPGNESSASSGGPLRLGSRSPGPTRANCSGSGSGIGFFVRGGGSTAPS
jgi:hypothetical protein